MRFWMNSIPCNRLIWYYLCVLVKTGFIFGLFPCILIWEFFPFELIEMFGYGSSAKRLPSSRDAVAYKKAHEFLTSPKSSLLLRLKSGEVMTYCQVGDSQGIPVLWIAGPISNRFVIGLYEQLCIDLGIRLLCFDRPGRGASTPLKNPKEWGFDSWHPYLEEAMDILKIEKFYLVAHSFGCAYALANYEKLKHRIIGSLRFLATWAPTNCKLAL